MVIGIATLRADLYFADLSGPFDWMVLIRHRSGRYAVATAHGQIQCACVSLVRCNKSSEGRTRIVSRQIVIRYKLEAERELESIWVS